MLTHSIIFSYYKQPGPSRAVSTLRLLRLTMWVLLAPDLLKSSRRHLPCEMGHMHFHLPADAFQICFLLYFRHSTKKTEAERRDHTKAVGLCEVYIQASFLVVAIFCL